MQTKKKQKKPHTIIQLNEGTKTKHGNKFNSDLFYL